MYIHVGTVNTSNTWKQNPPQREMFLYAPVTSNQDAKDPAQQSTLCSDEHKPLGTNGGQKNICDRSPSLIVT